MKRETLFFLVLIIIWIGMIIWTFFWWNWEIENIQDEESWFIETINNTWDTRDTTQTSTWSTGTTTTQIDTTQTSTWNNIAKEYTEIRVMMPRYFYNSDLDQFAKDLYNNKKIDVKYIFTDNLNSYRQNLSNPDYFESDLFLYPYDRNEVVNAKLLSIGSNNQPLFDELIATLFEKWKIKIIPFAADPMIMYSSVDLAKNDFSEIANLVYDWNPKIQLAFPIFFWVTSEDYDNKWFPREYKDIIRYALLHYFKKYQDSNALSTRININLTEGSNEFRNYNVKDLNFIANTINQSECKNFPSICFQIYNFVWIRFWFLSDADIVQEYFQQKKSSFEKISKIPMPFSSIESPVRIRWRWISDNIQDYDTENAVYNFLIEYMNKHTEYNLRNSTLSVFKTDWESLLDNPYIWIRWYILETWWDYMDTLRGINPFRQLIDHQITPKDFLKKI